MNGRHWRKQQRLYHGGMQLQMAGLRSSLASRNGSEGIHK